ncbi:unnamed protein product [Meloidogyne enterolobii]|uniref:Uncharacterized protein n=1 Tax=Meloidogyne enterolobii TaxID=390850 RepID=A0ACB0XXQ4_MELEN
MGIIRRFSSLSSNNNNIKNKNLNSTNTSIYPLKSSFDNENNLKEETSSSSSSNSSSSKTTEKVDNLNKQTFDINANLEAYKQRCKALEVENKRLMSNLGIMIENNNKNKEELNQLKEQMMQQNNEKQELLNLVQRLNADYEKERELARELQRVGQFNNKVIQRDIQRYQSRIERLEQKCAKMTSESVELKKLCLYLSRQRQALWAQLSNIEKTKNNSEIEGDINSSNTYKSTHDMIESCNSQFQLDGVKENALQLIYSDMQSSYLLAQLEAAPHRKGQQLEKEENEYSTIPCFCSSTASSTLTNTTNFGSSFGSSFSDDTTTIFVLDNDGREQFNNKIDLNNIILQSLPQLQVRELCTINEEKESDNDNNEETNEYLNIQNNWKFKENTENILNGKNREELKLENFKNKNNNRNSSTSTTSSSSSSGAFSATSSNGDEFRGGNEDKREEDEEEENDYLPPEMPLLKQEPQQRSSINTSTISLIGRPSSCMETNNILNNFEEYQLNTTSRSTLPRVNNNNSSNIFPLIGTKGRLSPPPRRKMEFLPNEQQQKLLLDGKILGGPPMRIRIRPPPTNSTIQMPQLIKKDLHISNKNNIITAL